MVTYENQKTIYIHKEKCIKDFMQVQNKHIREAYKTLNNTGRPVYIYLAGNSDGFDLALSRKDVMEEMGISKDTYHRGVKNLEDNQYLVHRHGNMYDFYTRPLWKIKEESAKDSRTGATTLSEDSRKAATINDDTVALVRLSSTENDRTGATHSRNTATGESQGCDYIVANQHTQIDSIDSINSPILERCLSDTPDGNFVSSEHSSSARHPADAEPSTKAAAQPSAVPETKGRKTKQKWDEPSREKYLNTLDDDKLEKIDYLLSIDKRYNDICKEENIELNSLSQDSRRYIANILDKRKKDRKIEEDRNNIISSIDKNNSVLNRLSEYFRSTPEEAKDNLVKYGMKPDILLECFENNELYRYEQWEKESKKSYPSHVDWVWTLYESNVINADDINTGNSVVASSSSSYIETEDFNNVANSMIDDVDNSGLTQADLDWLASL